MELPDDYSEEMTDEEMVLAYLKDGFSREDAETLMSVWRHAPDGFPVI